MKWSESHSVVSNSLWPRGVVHGILQERILEWVTFPFSWRSSQPRDGTQLSHIAGRFFTSWAIRLIKMLTEFQCDLIPGSWVWDVSFAVSITVLAQVLSFHILFTLHLVFRPLFLWLSPILYLWFFCINLLL